MVTPNFGPPRPDFSYNDKPKSEGDQTSPVKPRSGPPSPVKKPRPESVPSEKKVSRRVLFPSDESVSPSKPLSDSQDGRPPNKVCIVSREEYEGAPESSPPEDLSGSERRLPGDLQEGIAEKSKLFRSSRKLSELTKTSPMTPFSMSAENQNDVYITKGIKGDVVFKPGNVSMLNKMCDGIAGMVGLGASIPRAKAGRADVISKQDLHVDSRSKQPLINDYQRLTNHEGKEVLVDLSSDLAEKAEDVEFQGDVIRCTIEDQDVCLVASDDGQGLKVVDPSAVKTPIEIAADKSNKFKILNKEDDEDSVFLAPERSLGKISENKATGKVALINGYIYKLILDKKSGNYILQDLKHPMNQGKNLDETLLSKKFSIMEDEDEDGDKVDVIVPNDLLVELDRKPAKGKGISSFDFMGKKFMANPKLGKPGTYEIQVKPAKAKSSVDEELPFEDETVSLVKDSLGDYHVISKEHESVIVKEHKTVIVKADDSLKENRDGSVIEEKPKPKTIIETKEYVIRNGQKYDIIATDKGYNVVGHNISGMVQSKVEDIFTKPTKSRWDIDIRQNTPARKEFYDRIDMQSFEDAFLLTILLRPQDGKVVDLGQSNVLFQAISVKGRGADPQDQNVKLRPVLIDLDETMPKNNGYSLDPQFVDDGKHHVHCVRCGLLGFPQARMELKGEDRERLLNFATKLKANRELLIGYLKTFAKDKSSFTQENVEAFEEVVDRTLGFIHNNLESTWTLQDLFFHVFPEYEKQWNQLGDEDPEIKASRIGFEDEKYLKPRK